MTSFARRVLTLFLIGAACSLVPAGAAVASDGPWAVVASINDGLVTTVDLSTGAVVAQQQIGIQTVGVAAIGREVAVTDFAAGLIDGFHAREHGDVMALWKNGIRTT